MKYQSELIKEIVDTRGHEKSSIHYESECVESWIEETKGAYPKLCDYQSEWLNYINENPLGEFPYETVTDVSDATINNVVPYAYKSAILKGNTLVNIIDKPYSVSQDFGDSNKEFTFKFIKPNTYYFIIYDIDTDAPEMAIGFLINNNKWSNRKEGVSIQKGYLKLDSGSNPNYFRIITKNEYYLTVNSIMVIEYQDGMENWDIPYFVGMQSVKMPVLTTSNADSTKTNILSTSEDVELRGIGDVQDTLDCLTGEITERVGEIVLDGSENWSYHENLSTDVLAVFSVYNNYGYLEWLGDGSILCDKFPVIQERPTDSNASEGIYDKDGWAGKNKIPLIINKDRLSSVSVDGLKSWLANNQLKLQFKLQNKSIKTVDLTVIDQDGNTLSTIKPIEGTMHIHSDGTPLKPTFTLEIPVEATSQNLASFIKEE